MKLERDCVMKEPLFSDFPLKEYISRQKRARNLMEEFDINALILTEEDNIRYFTGYHTIYFGVKLDFQLFILPRDGMYEGALLIPNHLAGVANTSCIEDVRHWIGEGPATKDDYREDAISVVVDTLKDFSLTEGNIGMAFGNGFRLGMSQVQLEMLKDSLPKVKFVDCSKLLWNVRSIKSSLEIEAIRRACDITAKGYKAGLLSLKEGITEREISNIICSEMIKEGYDNVAALNPWVLIMQSGSCSNWCDAIPKNLKLKKGDLVLIDGGACYKGYHADMIRMGCIGKPTKKQKNMYDASVAANDAAINLIKPGSPCSKLFYTAMDVLRNFGFGKSVDDRIKLGYSIGGHGIGLSLHELPIIRAENEDLLKEGMTLSVEFFVVDKLPFDKAEYFILIEQTVAITNNGYDLLTTMSKELFVS